MLEPSDGPSRIEAERGLGQRMDQGALMRYLSEMIWFPAAFLGDNVSFEEVDDTSARVTLIDQGRSVSGMLFIDAEGRLTEYGELAGLKLPVRGKAVWKLAEGNLEYIDVAITALEYNVVPQRL